MLGTFTIGGVHPPGNKLSSEEKIQALPLPERVVIPLGQHRGAPATAIVAKGDVVKAGQLIAQADGFVSANVHSSVSGTVASVDGYIDASGFSCPAVTINVEGDIWLDGIDRSKKNECNIIQTKENILKLITDAGIVGMGGATFPTHVKLSPPAGSKVEVLIINGVECEPYLTSDHRVMLERAEDVLVGVQILMKVLGVNRAIIGVESNKKDAIERLQELTGRMLGIEVISMSVKYPQGSEKQLIKAAINRSVPSRALPIAVGVVVQNVSTALAVYEAVMKHKPLIERVVTVTGKSLKKPGNYLCRIGTPTSALIDAAGGLPEDTVKIIGGGPMMGRAMLDVNAPITKGSSGILLINTKEGTRKPSTTCIRCAKCVSACPMGLEPYLLMVYSEKGMFEGTERERIMDCMECGSCSFTCPANRPLLDYIRLGKARTGAIIKDRK
ncbi:electron transport complex subunit C [Bacteroidia bacterium]|nr:electron transport complex subunit C [Bacteroidia bacterium]